MLSLGIIPQLRTLKYTSKIGRPHPTLKAALGASLTTPYYSMISDTVPAPTVRPPSLIANLNPFSIAIGFINSISN